MKLFEVESEKVEIKPARAGVYPVYTDAEGKTYVHMMIPSDARFGGIEPQMGKGGIDEGESEEQAAMREGYEELGLLASNVERTYLLDKSVRKGMKARYELTVFVAEIKDPDNFDPAGWESGWAGWVEINAAIRTTRKDQQKYVKAIQSKYAAKSLKEAFDPTEIEQELADLEKALPDMTPRSAPARKLDARISFLRSQLELSRQHGIDPEPNPDHIPSDPSDFKEHDFTKWSELMAPAMATIKRECQPYLKAIGNDIAKYTMFRGMPGTDKAVITGRVRLTGRKPMSTGDSQHDYLNLYFKQKFGQPFRDAMFVVGEANFAADYGSLYLIFPRGDFNFAWSPEIKDLFNVDFAMEDALYPDGDDETADVENFFKWMEGNRYQNSNLKAALLSKNEIMVRSIAYYGINVSEFFERNDQDDDDMGNGEQINTAIEFLQDYL